MKFIALFIFVLNCIRGNITRKMIYEVNKEVIIKNGLFLSILDSNYIRIYGNVIVPKFSRSYLDKKPLLKSLIDKICGEDKPPGILSATLNYFFSSSKETINTESVLDSSFAKKYFSDKESRSKNIKMFSMFFLKLLQKDESIKFKSNFFDKQNAITDSELLEILNTNIKVDQNTLVFTLLTLNAFMLKILGTKDELTEYVTNILDHLTDEDIKIIRISPKYCLDYDKVVREINEKSIFNKLIIFLFASLSFIFKSCWNMIIR